MATPVQTYAFRRTTAVFAGPLATATAGQSGELARIEAELLAAHTAFTRRRYREAVTHYRAAEQLIWRQLDSRGPSRPVVDFSPPRAASMYEPLIEVGLEWSHTLAVPQARPGPGPVTPLDSKVLDAARAVDEHGLKASKLAAESNAEALSLLVYGSQLQAAGNAEGAAQVRERANKLAPEVVALYQRDNTNGVPVTLTAQRELNLITPEGERNLSWRVGEPPTNDVLDMVYKPRTRGDHLIATDRLVNPVDVSDFALSLGHMYFYEVPLGLAECYHALGDWAAAQTQYLRAAAYQYLNPATEAPFLWVRLGTLYVDWGVSLYRTDQFAEALTVLGKVLTPDRTVPNSPLWTTAGLAQPANTAKLLMPLFDNVEQLATQAAMATVLLSAWEQLVKLKAGLDFWGMPAQFVPIWTYDYLRSVAGRFAELAVSVERDVINFWSRAEAADLTRLQLVQATGQAQAELTATQLQAEAVAAEVDAFEKALALANQRAADAATDAADYAAMSRDAIMHQALSAQLSGGDDGNASQLDALADRMILGGYSISGDRGTLAAAESLTAARLNQEYEVARMQRQAEQMQLAAQQAGAELAAAQARASAAQAGVAVAQLRAANATELLAAFDAQLFTAEVWWRMGDTLEGLYRRYLSMALKTARLMQQAYNFETDSAMTVIRADYSNSEVAGLLAADALMADITSFDYNLVTQTKDKVQPVKLTVSLAERHGYAFETQFRKTGRLDFETVIDDFDRAFPGTYAGRIEAVEVAVEGLVPAAGFRGTLTNNGVSAYRVPGALPVKYRLQPRETMVLSEFARRADEPLIPADQRVRGLFSGAGVASSWLLELPKSTNDLDYGALLDVKLTFYYRARFDPVLKDAVLAALAAQPSINAGQRAVPLRWLYPDAFFRLQATGELAITLGPADFPRAQTNPQLTGISAILATDGSVPAGGIALDLATPGHSGQLRVTTAADGTAGGAAWGPLATGAALGEYLLTVPADANPALVHDGALDLTPITNIALVLGYSFTPRT